MPDEGDEYETLLSSNKLQTNWYISDPTRQGKPRPNENRPDQTRLEQTAQKDRTRPDQNRSRRKQTLA
jgi:hypothetical protein